jgi:glycosyltransferase involved in cell wall biosynthesis
MAAPRDAFTGPLRIAHVFRAPLGGLFRHVVDLAATQVADGHEVGLFFDNVERGPQVAAAMNRIPGGLKLGVAGSPIRRNPHVSDLPAMARFAAWASKVKLDVIHGHGSKGGLYARLSGLWRPGAGPIRAYTPHGGSFNYRPGAFSHRAYMAAEWAMALRTDVYLFESAYIAGRFDAFVGSPHGARRIVANGISEAELEKATPNADAADLFYVGELRSAKGIDTLIDALALVGRATGEVPRTVLVGSGPDKDMLTAQAARLGIADRVSFPGPMPVREAFKLGRVLVVPSRAESMPYIVLEAAAASVPMIANDVGGIPEIFGPYAHWLGPADDAVNLARRIVDMSRMAPEAREEQAADLSWHVAQNFSIRNMVDAVMAGYRAGHDRRAAAGLRAEPKISLKSET